jgi:hypothetical protein
MTHQHDHLEKSARTREWEELARHTYSLMFEVAGDLKGRSEEDVFTEIKNTVGDLTGCIVVSDEIDMPVDNIY